MRLGISSYTYGWAIGTDANRPPNAPTAIDLIDRACEFDVRVLQLCDNLPAATYETDSITQIAAHAAARGIAIELGTQGIEANHLIGLADLAARLGSPILRCVIDTRDDHPSPDEVVQRLSAVTNHFATQGVTLAIENHDRFSAATLADIVRRLRSPHVGICLDTANSFGAMEGPQAVVETLGPHVVNLHIKDFVVRRFPNLMGFTIEGRPAGHGMLDIPWVLRRLNEFGRDCSAIIELWTPPEPTPAETLRKEADWARQSVEKMRQWITD